MICPSCQKEIPSNSSSCCYCGITIPLCVKNGLQVEKLSDKNQTLSIHQEEEPTWGMFINDGLHRHGTSKTCPGWIKPIQRSNWEANGLIIWDKKAGQVTKLWAGQAVKLLNEMIETEAWKETGVTVGEPAMQIRIDKPRKSKRKGKKQQETLETQPPEEPQDSKWVLMNEIDLSANQSFELFNFLNANKNLLQKIAHEEQRETSRRLSEVYRIILGDQLWSALGVLYQTEPDSAMKLGMDAVRTALGETEKQDLEKE